jgi:hypothetical protein
VVEATARSFLSQIPSLTSAQRRVLGDQLIELLSGKKPPPSPTEAAAVRLLVALEDKRTPEVLWDRIVPSHSPETRAAALQALGKWIDTPGKEQLKRLFSCAGDSDFRIAAPALMLLKGLPDGDKLQAGWLQLVRAPDLMVRRVAVEKVGERDSAEVAEALLEQLQHPDRSLRDASLARLARLKHGREALIKALLEAENPDRAWSLAKAQAPYVRDYSAGWRDKVFTRACSHLEAEDRRSDALFFLLRDSDAADLRDRLEEKGAAHRKKKEYEKALQYFRLLARDPACAFPIRLELAACALKRSAHDLATQARMDDPALQQFAGLFQHHQDELFGQLEKIKWLEAEDLYFLGFDFIEKDGASRKFGDQVLHLLLKRSPRSTVAKSAKTKLRQAGVE